MSTTEQLRGSATLTPACQCTVINRGPNWLFIRVELTGEPCGVGERLWRIAESQFIYRLVIEFDAKAEADAAFGVKLGQELGTLCNRLTQHGGALRLCGLTPHAAHAIVGESGCPRLHNHATTHDAVWCGPSCDGDQPEETVVAAFEKTTRRSPPRSAK
ncbi:hypothetical protein Pla108_27580 [Botrimarina colliarenosi]|uniref:STAS domain-containing protein n=1 Tax=Botrimarina colliarenosi TaxID=2528001 RepID=A0A5C6AD42_9BACT|nr:hypothetical protein [Botrimarina colliarenosi]TWT96981.1 hypothetical protein Pla108_27580 [Botrimarina colliarenosi]